MSTIHGRSLGRAVPITVCLLGALSLVARAPAVVAAAAVARTPARTNRPLEAPDTTGATYHPIDPARIVDTRAGVGIGSALTAGVGQSFQVATVANVPSGAVAVTGNLTVTDTSYRGYVALTPAQVDPTTVKVSTLNFPTGDTRANGVTVPLGQDGRLWALYVSGRTGDTANVVFDVTGYYAADTTGATYHPIDPARIVDTRAGVGIGGRLTTGSDLAFQVSTLYGVPVDASAVTGNVTATDVTNRGYVALTPTRVDPTSVKTSTLNVPTWDTRANGVTLPLGPDGRLWALFVTGRTGDTANLVFDVTGYFLAPAGTAPRPYPLYFMSSGPNLSLPTDANGVVQIDYGSPIGIQYNPVSIAEQAIAYYDSWQFAPLTDAQRTAYKAGFFAQVGWLVANQQPDGRWLYTFPFAGQPVPWWSAMAEGLGMSALIRAYSVTGDASYVPLIQRARATFEKVQGAGGVTSSQPVGSTSYLVYEEYMPPYAPHTLNGWMFAMVGLYEDWVYFGDTTAYTDFYGADRGVATLHVLLPYYDTGSWSLYDLTTLQGTNRGSAASLTYHQVHITELRYYATITGDRLFSDYARRFQSYLDRCLATSTCPR